MPKLKSDNQYENIKFDGLIQDDETFGDIEFEGCRFVQCSFQSTLFRGCKFIECEFFECDLSLLKLDYSQFTNTQFLKCKLVGIDWTKAAWQRKSLLNQSPIGFDQCHISYSIFIGLELNRLRIVNCVAIEADFSEAKLKKANCSGTDFKSSRFSQTDLEEADFTGASQYSIDITNNRTKNAKFSLPEAISLLNFLDIIIEDFGS